MHNISTAAIFGASQRSQHLKVSPPAPIKLNAFCLTKENLEAAKALPADLFQDDPQVLKLLRAIEERKAQIPAEIRQWLDSELASLKNEIAHSEKTLARAVFADSVAKDTDFGKTDAAMKHLCFLKDLVAAIEGSKEEMDPFMAQAVSKDQAVIDMGAQLGDRLWLLRIAHLEKQLNQGRNHREGFTRD